MVRVIFYAGAGLAELLEYQCTAKEPFLDFSWFTAKFHEFATSEYYHPYNLVNLSARKNYDDDQLAAFKLDS